MFMAALVYGAKNSPIPDDTSEKLNASTANLFVSERS